MTNSERAYNKRLAAQELGRQDAREKNSFHLACCMLFWAEGGKRKNSVQFTNCDGDMMAFFVKGLLEVFKVRKEKIKLEIRCYASNDEEVKAVNNFWIEKLGLTKENIWKTYVNLDPRSKICPERSKKYKYGTCQIRIADTQLVQRMFGAIQEYGSFTNDNWINSKLN